MSYCVKDDLSGGYYEVINPSDLDRFKDYKRDDARSMLSKLGQTIDDLHAENRLLRDEIE